MSNKPIRRIYSDEFKMDAVALIFEHEYSVPEAARHLEMSVKTLQKWKRRYEVENETPSVESAAKEEINIKESQLNVIQDNYIIAILVE